MDCLLKKNYMKNYLETRIKELNEADAKACAKRWDMSKPEMVRKLWRDQSNEITFARQELEKALAFFDKLAIPLVGESVCEHVMESIIYSDDGVKRECKKCGKQY
jgi:hypothetical protein